MTEVLGAVVLAGTATALASLVVLHLLPTGLSPIHNAVSQYGITRFKAGYRVATIAIGVAGAAAALGIHRSLHGPLSHIEGSLVVFALARLAISWYPMDVPGTERSVTGRRHGLLAVLAFASIGYTANRLSSLLATTGQWHSIEGATEVVAWYALATILAMLATGRIPSLRSYFGLVERAFYVAMLALMALIGAALALAIS